MAPGRTELKRLLLVAPRMEPRGTSEYTLNLAKELLRLGIEAPVFCAPGTMLPKLRSSGVPVQVFEHLESIRWHLGERHRFLRAVALYGPQLVHAQSLRVAGAIRPLSRHNGVPLVLTVHWRPRRVRAFRHLSRTLRGIIVTTQAAREEIVNECGIDRAKVTAIPNGIDVEELAGTGFPAIFRAATPVVGSLGPIEEMRGHELFVRAAAQLVRSGLNAQFVIAGQGARLPEVRDLIADLDLDRYFTVATDFSTYADVLGAIDVVVQNSLVDVSGFSILEAMGHGRPVVSFNTGTGCELIEDGKTGILVPKGDVDALAEAIRRLLTDKDTARRMAQEALRSVREKFSIQTVARQTIEYYESILNEPEPGLESR